MKQEALPLQGHGRKSLDLAQKKIELLLRTEEKHLRHDRISGIICHSMNEHSGWRRVYDSWSDGAENPTAAIFLI